MGLNLEVGILADLKSNDEEGYEHYLETFQNLNQFLEQQGLSHHNEPDDCEVWSCDMFGYSGLHYLRRIAAHLDLNGKLPSPGDGDSHEDPVLVGYYKAPANSASFVSKLFSATKNYQRSFDHLILHSDAEGLYIPIDFAEVLQPDDSLEICSGPLGSSIQLFDECQQIAEVLEIPSHLNEESEELYEAVENQGSGNTTWQRYGRETYSCVVLLEACRRSVRYGAAIVFG